MMKFLLGFGLVALTVGGVGCGDDDEAEEPPVDSAEEATIEVVFDGTTCEATVPSSLAPGEYSFVLTDESDRDRTEMWLRHLVDGHTYDELVAALEEGGGQGGYISRPEWVEAVPMFAPESSSAAGRHEYAHVVEDGVYAFVIGGDDAIWLCGTFDVPDA